MKLNRPIPENILNILNIIARIIVISIWFMFISGFLWYFITLNLAVAIFFLILFIVFSLILVYDALFGY